MTISSTNRKAGPYAGNDVAVSFPFAFKVFAAADVLVVFTSASNVETVLTLTTNYTVSLNSNQDTNPGGTVKLLTALATGEKLTLSSAVANLQPVDLTNNGGFYPAVINKALDRATIQIQQLAEKLSRALVWPISSSGATLPSPESGKFIGWNDTADSLVNLAGTGTIADAENVGSNDGAGGSLWVSVAGFISRLMSSVGSSVVGFTQAGTGAVTRTTQDKMRESVSVLDFFANGGVSGPAVDPTGVIDSTLGIQAVINYATANGCDLKVPAGYYRITSTINVGLPFYSTFDAIINRTTGIDDATDATYQIPANIASNRLLNKITINCESGAFFVADFNPATYTPAVAYNLDNDSYDNTGHIRGLRVIHANNFVSGKYDSSVAYSANKIIGLYLGRGVKVTCDVLFAGLGCGLLSSRSYWTEQDGMSAFHCGYGFSFAGHNQATASNLNAHTCLVGYKYDGQAGKLTQFGTENCDTGIELLSLDSCTIGPAYLEDARTADGTDKFEVKFGHTENVASIHHSKFTNLVTLVSNSPNKKSFRFWGISKGTFTGCRSYGAAFTYDTLSNGYSLNSAITGIGINGVGEVGTNIQEVVTQTFGDWTPQLFDAEGHGFTSNTVAGRYVKTGNMVFATCNYSWSNIGSANASPLILTGLPFPTRNIAALTNSVVIGEASGIDTSAGTKDVAGFVAANTSYVLFKHVSDNTTSAEIAANSCSAVGSISLSVTYICA